MDLGPIVGCVVGCLALVLLCVVSYRIFVVDKRVKIAKLTQKASEQDDSGASKADTNVEVFDSAALGEIAEEGPAAWYWDVDLPTPRIRQTLSVGQCYLNFPKRAEIAVTNLPLPLQQRSAFSVKFVSGVSGIVSVGLSWRPGPHKLPGHFIRSVGLQCDGFVYSGQPDVWRRTIDGSFQDGDTMTVLVDRTKGQVQWLKNGEFIIDAQQMTGDIPISMSLPVLRMDKGFAKNAAIFPAIGLHGSVVIETNFGFEGKSFKGLEEYDDLVFGRGDCPAGAEDALDAAKKSVDEDKLNERVSSSPNAAAAKKKLLKRASTMNAADALDSSTTVQERIAKLRALRLTNRSKRGAISEDADRLQARFHQAMQRSGIDASEYCSHQVSGTDDARQSRLRQAAATLDVKTDRCRFGSCNCTQLVLPERSMEEQLDPGSTELVEDCNEN
jgi:hypothetical protein